MQHWPDRSASPRAQQQHSNARYARCCWWRRSAPCLAASLVGCGFARLGRKRRGEASAQSRNYRRYGRPLKVSQSSMRGASRPRSFDVSCGSIATETSCSCDVRFPPESHRIADVADWQLRATNGRTLICLLWERMLEEETQHFPRGVRSSRVSVRGSRAASRPCVSCSVDVPVLKNSASARIGMDRAGEGVSSGYPPAMHLLLRARCSHRLLKNMIAVVWMHCDVAITVKNNGRDRWPVT